MSLGSNFISNTERRKRPSGIIEKQYGIIKQFVMLKTIISI